MALVTGTPIGTIEATEEIYLDSAPTIYIQNALANPLYNDDDDGFYWNMSGTATYSVYEIGCLTDVSLTEDVAINDVLCDDVGVKATVQQRNYIQFEFTLQSFFPYQTLRHLLSAGEVTEVAPTQKFGFGPIDNSLFWHVYAPKVYDQTAADYIWFYFHRAKFVEAWSITMPFGSPWQVTGLRLRAYADTSKPSAQQFGMMGRADASVIT